MDIFLSVNQADLLISHHSINIHRRIPANTTRLPLMIQLIFSQLPHLVLTHRQSNAAMGVMEGAFLWALTLKQRLASVSKRLMETDICPADLTADVPCKVPLVQWQKEIQGLRVSASDHVLGEIQSHALYCLLQEAAVLNEKKNI